MKQFLERLYADWPWIVEKTVQHIELAIAAVLVACLIAIPLGILGTRYERLSRIIIMIVSVIQTIPSLALFGLLIPFIGIGFKPALVALTLHAIFPILQNTYEGIAGVNKSLIEAGKGMGMTSSQLMLKVELPIASSFIMGGIRLATVGAVSGATIASYIAAGGLGDIIVRGLASINTIILLEGAIPVSLLVILMNILLYILQYYLVPRGLRHTVTSGKRKG
jgi:osmoprotectant transport system permease protein